MSFPNIIYGDFGDEKVTSSTRIGNLPLGAKMVLPDGSEYAHAKASATALVAGNLYQSNTMTVVAGSADTGMTNNLVLVSDVAASARSLTVTLAGTAGLSKNLLKDGYIWVNDVTGEGERYRIKSHLAAAQGANVTITLEDNDYVRTALVAGTTQLGMRHNEFDNVTITTANTVKTGHLAGWATVPVTASYYCWLLRRGVVSALAQGTLVHGEQVIASQTTGGAVGPQATGTIAVQKERHTIGEVMAVPAASTEYGLIKASLP